MLKLPDSSLPPDALQELQGIYAGHDLLLGSDALPFAEDESHALPPAPVAAVFPCQHDQVVQTVQWANRHHVALVPSGGRTGLSGGACAGKGELVLSMAKMNRILSFDAIGGQVAVEAGVVLQDVQEYVAARGWFYPVDYASRGSAQMGGAVATNAGGIRVLRYGMTRHWVAGLKAVTGKGETLDINRNIAKDNAGYDLKELLVGSEGTLAVITEVTLQLTSPMNDQQTVLLGLSGWPAAISLFAQLNQSVSLNAAEFFCERALAHVCARHGMPGLFPGSHPLYLLIEFDKAAMPLEALSAITGDADAIISNSIEQTHNLWRYRELVSSSINPLKPYKNDIACSLARLEGWVFALENGFRAVDPRLECVWFGHLGDGNIHLNIIRPEMMSQLDYDKAISQCSCVIADVTRSHAASVSAEHGIGLLKAGLLGFARSEVEINLYRQIRQVFDPNGILNPGKLFGSIDS